MSPEGASHGSDAPGRCREPDATTAFPAGRIGEEAGPAEVVGSRSSTTTDRKVATEALLRRFCAEMLVSGKRVTAVPAEEAWTRHIEDGRRGLTLVDAEPAGSIIDVGSGNGVPGLVLAIERPDRDVVLLEANGRKAASLSALAASLGLPHVSVLSERAETAAAGLHRDRHAIAVSRALAPPVVTVEYCLPLVRPGGCLIAWLGTFDAKSLGAAARELGGHAERVLRVPGSRQQALVVIRKTEATPPQFPRRPGMAAKKPIVAT